jgi:hypothetical protein
MSSNHVDKKIGYSNIPISYKLNKFFEILKGGRGNDIY